MNIRKFTSRWPTMLLVAGGIVLAPAAILADEVVADDVIIDGSACIGADCVENMDFAFSTIQLQSEDPRLQLNGNGDNDWEIVANGKNNGNYLGFVYGKGQTRAIVFRIKAGAPENSLLIKSNGRLGIGTEQPTRKLHVMGWAQIDGDLIVGELQFPSSRSYKQDIEALSPSAALEAVIDLQPVSYRLVAEPDAATVGFIAEQVPDLLASPGRESIEPMKIIAALTGAIQAQGESIAARQRQSADLGARLERLEQALATRSGRAAR